MRLRKSAGFSYLHTRETLNKVFFLHFHMSNTECEMQTLSYERGVKQNSRIDIRNASAEDFV